MRNVPEEKKAWTQPVIKHNELTKWGWKVGYPEHFVLGINTDIGTFTYINARFGVKLEDNVQIGSHCSIYSHNTINNTHGPVLIQEGAKIGSHSVILPNVVIKRGQLIKAGSVAYERDGIVYVRTPTLYSFIDTILEGKEGRKAVKSKLNTMLDEDKNAKTKRTNS